MHITFPCGLIIDFLVIFHAYQALAFKNQTVHFKKKTSNGGLVIKPLDQLEKKSLISCIDHCLKTHKEFCLGVSYNKVTKRCTSGGLNSLLTWRPQASDVNFYRESRCDGHPDFKLYPSAYVTSCLWVSNDQRDYSSAKSNCISMHAHLVTLKERNKIDVLKQAVRGKRSVFWIGLDDEHSEGHFQWVDDHQVLTPVMYSWLFSKNTPDNQGDEDCVTYADNVDLFNDEKCEKTLNYVCEINL